MDDRLLKSFTRSFRKGMIGKMESRGWCAKISWALQGYLSFALQIKSEVHVSQVGRWNHVYLVLADGRVLDATADQFNEEGKRKKYPQIYLGEPLEIHKGKPYEVKL